jgi:hypothetical protein
MQAFDKLGAEVERRWAERHDDAKAFPEVATAALERSGALHALKLRDVADWFTSAPDLPGQRPSKFGQPPLVVYRSERFFIEVLVWIDTPTSIHQHAFSGAFGVLHGSSFHTEYRFKARERICRELVAGDLDFVASESLRQGDVRTIRPGAAFVHSLLHLEPPTLSVVVRTYNEPEYAPQYRYMKPGLGYDPHHAPEPASTKLKLMEALVRTQPEMFAELGERLASAQDPWFAYKILELGFLSGIQGPRFAALLGAARARHPELTAAAGPALEYQRRHIDVAKRMRELREEEMRYFLAMLMNMPSLPQIEALVARRFPGGDPQAKIVGWIERLAANGALGFALDDAARRLLKSALHGANVDAALEAFEGAGPERIAHLRKTWYQIHSVPLLQPLFERGAAPRPENASQ